jgi:hypothetical protein
MDLFFEPFKFGVTDANNPMEFVDPTLGVRDLYGRLSFVGKGIGHTGLSGITPLLDLRRINLKIRGYLVNGFVAFEGSQGNGCFLFGSELSSHVEDLPLKCIIPKKRGLIGLYGFGLPL